MLTKDELETALNALSVEAQSVGGWGNKKWTRKIKETLKLLAHAKDESIKVYGTGLGDDCYSEWLWDVVWALWKSEDDSSPAHLDSLLLVVESEWGKYEDVIEDFEKLLVARADVRVIVYDDLGRYKERLFEGEFESRINSYRGTKTGDRYLFAFYRTKNEKSASKFEVKEYCA